MEFWLNSPLEVKTHPLLELDILSSEPVCEHCPRLRALAKTRHQWEEESRAYFGGHGEPFHQSKVALSGNSLCPCRFTPSEDSLDWLEAEEVDEFW